jgi:hypothetical protein
MSAPEMTAFFAAMAPMLAGRIDAAQVESRLGPSPSGTAALGFYTELVRRNLHKIVSDVFPAVRAICRTDGGEARWVQLATEYAVAHPGTGADPNHFAARFPQWLVQQSGVPAVWAELADYEWTRLLAFHAPDVSADIDGFDARLFIRQYSSDIPRLAVAALRGEVAAAEVPVLVAVFRHARTARLGTFRLGAAGLAALARRRGLPLPASLGALSDDAIVQAADALVEAGVLVSARSPDHRSEPCTHD